MEGETRQPSEKNGLPAIGRHNTVLFVQPGLADGKKLLINLISKGFDQTTQSVKELAALPDEIIPVVGCQMELRELEESWRERGRTFVYWDRGYLNRGGKTWLKRRGGPEYFRWHVSAYQMRGVDENVGPERFDALRLRVHPWRRGGHRIIVAAPSKHYTEFHRLDGWTERVVAQLRKTGRPVAVRHKTSGVPLDRELLDAHCLVTHGSVAAIEAVVMGCPVIVDPQSAAAPVGRTSVSDIENLNYPDRAPWLRALANSQFTANEVANGRIWDLLR